MNFAAFDLNLLRVLDALLRERSVTRAGEQIGLSQPAMSNALNRLRHTLGDQLFVRRGNDILPTPRAETLREPIRDALARLEHALSADAKFDPAATERTYTLVGSDYFSKLLMPELADRIAAVAPRISLRLLDDAAGDAERLLRDDAIDVALRAEFSVPEWISRQSLFAAPFVIVAARDHPKIQAAGVKAGEPLPLELFCSLPHAMRSTDGSTHGFVDDALEKVDRKRRVVLALPHFHAVALAVARGRLIAALPEPFAKFVVTAGLKLDLFKPPVPVPARELFVYWHKRHDQNTAHRWLREQIAACRASVA